MYDISKEPSYHLALFALLLNDKQDEFKVNESRSIEGTIINRAYYSSFHISKLWLEDHHQYLKTLSYYKAMQEPYTTEHTQIKNLLIEQKEHEVSKAFNELKNLRKKADYEICQTITLKDLEQSLELFMKTINELCPKTN